MKLGVQLYTLRASFERDLDGTLAGLAKLGVRHVELAGSYGLSASAFRERLDAHGLSSCGSHVGLDALRDDLAGVVADAEVLGHRHVVLPWVSKDALAEGWDAFGRSLTPIGAALADAGLQFSYHNHAFEFVPVGSGTGYDALFASADPVAVHAEVDVGWVSHAGHDPVGLIRKLGRRVSLVHLKDFTNDLDALDIEAGKGIVPWDGVLSACEEVGTLFGIVELDNPPEDPLESVRKSLEFFRSRGLTG